MITVDKGMTIEKAERLLAEIPGGIEKALYRSFNRALQEGRTVAIREAAKLYTIKSRDIRATFKMHRASRSNLDAQLTSIGATVPLTKYSHKPKEDTTVSKKTVRVGVRKGSMKPMGAAFVWDGKIMQRVGSSPYPITQKHGPAVPSILDNQKIAEAVMNKMETAVPKRLEHETMRLLEGNK